DGRERDREAGERAEREGQVGEPADPGAPGDEALRCEVASRRTEQPAALARAAYGLEQRPGVEGRRRAAPEGARPVNGHEAGGHRGGEVAAPRRVEMCEPGGC